MISLLLTVWLFRAICAVPLWAQPDVVCVTPAGEHTLSSVEVRNGFVCLYDSKGECYKRLSASEVGEVKGFGPTFFVSKNGAWIHLYNAEGARYKSITASLAGEVTGVSDETFTTRDGPWIHTYDRNGKRVSTRKAL